MAQTVLGAITGGGGAKKEGGGGDMLGGLGGLLGGLGGLGGLFGRGGNPIFFFVKSVSNLREKSTIKKKGREVALHSLVCQLVVERIWVQTLVSLRFVMLQSFFLVCS